MQEKRIVYPGKSFYKPAASREELLVGVEVMFVLSWSKLEGISSCVQLVENVNCLQFFRASSWAVQDESNPAFINSEDAEFIAGKCFDFSTRKYSSATFFFFNIEAG